MLKVYKVIRTDDVDYDEYDMCIVVAKDEDDAFKIADANYYVFKRNEVEITEIDLNKAQAVMGSYCAG